MDDRVEWEDEFKKLKMLYTIREKMTNIPVYVGRHYERGMSVSINDCKTIKSDRSDIKRQLEHKIIELEIKIIENI